MKRRVTVHFGDVRVVVPCHDENITVSDLAEAAILRYKKATGKVNDQLFFNSTAYFSTISTSFKNNLESAAGLLHCGDKHELLIETTAMLFSHNIEFFINLKPQAKLGWPVGQKQFGERINLNIRMYLSGMVRELVMDFLVSAVKW
ncbi:hypothetical protein DICVIV_11608 [Dictyocaulus viviparus]|uniref:Par3/HAL N-terminal domain-containing protein n=1 Tax=Dictyocaulus viviparus TaxID=29172 RepID=A0A0D8XCS6_DICVI|nr:hypothetical protein DICVIV_11608 [Dictyocaulus viviparus]